jgi:signal transduction histidine kinase
MAAPERRKTLNGFAQRLAASGLDLPRLWGRQGFWQVRLRWAVAPTIVASVAIGLLLGFEFPVLPVLLIAAASPLYNLFFALIFKHYEGRLREDVRLDTAVTVLEVLLDYAVMFLLIYVTGGASSPLSFFLIFHVIIAAIQFRPITAYGLAGLAAAGLWMMFLGQTSGWIEATPITFRGEPVHVLDRPALAAVTLTFLSATLFITAWMVGRIMSRFRARVDDLAAVTNELASANDQLGSMYAMVCAIGAERRLAPVLDTVVRELATVMGVPAVAVKLLDEKERTLRYVAAHGLPPGLVQDTVISLDRSPLNRRVIEGETLVNSRVSRDGSLQLQDELIDLGIRSAVLTPLKIEDRVIGTLGLYSSSPDRFQDGETEFLELAARLAAIAIDDARANEEIEKLIEERTQFMLLTAHNLRAPLGAALGILELLRAGHMGQVSQSQTESLERIDERLRALHQTIGELLTIARARDWSREIPDVVVDMQELARYTQRTFGDQAERKGLRLSVVAGDDVPPVDSGSDLLQQVMENLVSNAIKYTPKGGEIEVRFSRTGENEVRIAVRDTGIGIPAEEQSKLFTEFFRASNAKRLTSSGTGLGLALVKKTVERHKGRVLVTSDESQGTTVVIDLPIRQKATVEY